MTVQSKKREKVGWSHLSLGTSIAITVISRRRTEKMFELMIESEMEKKPSKPIDDIFMRTFGVAGIEKGDGFFTRKGSAFFSNEEAPFGWSAYVHTSKQVTQHNVSQRVRRKSHGEGVEDGSRD